MVEKWDHGERGLKGGQESKSMLCNADGERPGSYHEFHGQRTIERKLGYTILIHFAVAEAAQCHPSTQAVLLVHDSTQ